MQRLTLGFLACSLGTPLTALAQTVHVLEAGGQGELQAAVDAAADGDVLLLRAPTYQRFSLSGKGLTLLNDRDGEVLILPSSAAELPTDIQDVPEGSELIAVGLTFSGSPVEALFPGMHEGLVLIDCSGSVYLEDCKVVSQPVGPAFVPDPEGTSGGGATVLRCGDVHIVRCDFQGNVASPLLTATPRGTEGLYVSQSRVSIFESTMIAGDPLEVPCNPFADCNQPTTTPPGIRVIESTLALFGCEVRGADGADGEACATAGFSAAAGGDGGAAVLIDNAGVQLVLGDNALVAGEIGSGSGSCPDGLEAMEVEGLPMSLTEFVQPTGSLAIPSPARPGELVPLSFTGQPGSLIFLAVSMDQGWSIEPGLGGVLALGLQGLEVLPPRTADGAGNAGGSVVFPSTSDVATYRLQALAFDANLLPTLTTPAAVTVVPLGI